MQKKRLLIIIPILLILLTIYSATHRPELQGAVEGRDAFCPSGLASFIISDSGSLIGWGDNYWGSVSNNGDSLQLPRVLLENVAAVYPGGKCVFALKKDGSLYGWGADIYGLLPERGEGREYQRKVMDDVSSFAAGEDFCMAVKENGDLFTWGRNSSGQLGIGSIDDERKHAATVVLEHVSKVRAYEDVAFAITEIGDAYWWGGEGSTSPTLFAADVVSISLKSQSVYQLLTTSNELRLFSLSNGIMKDENALAPPITGVSSIHDFGYITELGGLWQWAEDSNMVTRSTHLRNGVVSAQGVYNGRVIVRTTWGNIVWITSAAGFSWLTPSWIYDVFAHFFYIIVSVLLLVSVYWAYRLARNRHKKKQGKGGG